MDKLPLPQVILASLECLAPSRKGRGLNLDLRF
jgi:hypothetical protein